MVAAYIGAAYWFTASTSFADPVAVFGHMFSDSFAGIAPGSSAIGFALAQLAGLEVIAECVIFVAVFDFGYGSSCEADQGFHRVTAGRRSANEALEPVDGAPANFYPPLPENL